MKSKNDHFSALQCVQGLYRGILDREPDPEGLTSAAAALKGSGDIVGLCKRLLQSEEFRTLRNRDKTRPEASYSNPTWVFLHIQKTGGTALRKMLSKSFGDKKLYQEHADVLHAHSPSELSHYAHFAGHFNHDSLAYIPRRQLSVFTFVREPKARLLSAYYFWKAHKPIAAKSLLEFLGHKQRLVSNTWNHMTWALMGERIWKRWRGMLVSARNQDRVGKLIEDRMAPHIKTRLRKLFFVGPQEDYDQAVEVLFWLLGKPKPEIVRAHSLKQLMANNPNFSKTIVREPVTEDIDRALDALVQLDRIVYDESMVVYRELLAKFSQAGRTGQEAPVSGF